MILSAPADLGTVAFMGLSKHDRERRQLRLQAIHEAARRKGGRCLSDEYITTLVPLEFECGQGHRWHARPMSVVTGRWCSECHRRPRTSLLVLQALARLRGGQCLSETYEPSRMRWRCAAGHEWFASPKKIRGGSWCPRCAGFKTIEDLQAIAAERGGRCLIRSMAEAAHDACIEWECARGHRFAIRHRSVISGQWCSICRIVDDSWKKVLARADALAAQHGGRCLSRSRPADGGKTSEACLEWECAKGHRFAVRRRCVASGQWCPVCSKADGSWQQALARAQELGGRCLASGEPTTNQSVRWRCAPGHEWTASAYAVARGAWCPRCKGHRLGIEHMQEMAAERRGRCISRKYVDARTKLQWECEQGHRWWAEPQAIRYRESWCPQCERELKGEPKIADGWAKALERAAAEGGACIVPPDRKTDLSARWRCAKGHEWRCLPYKIAAGRWCSRCSGRRLDIEHMQAMAAERDGRCVSETYVNCQTKLQWECEKGHRWWARPTIVRTMGTWCPHCAWDRNAERMRSEAKDRR